MCSQNINDKGLDTVIQARFNTYPIFIPPSNISLFVHIDVSQSFLKRLTEAIIIKNR